MIEELKNYEGFKVSNLGYVIGRSGSRIQRANLSFTCPGWKTHVVTIRRIIARLFIGEPPEDGHKWVVRVKDGNPNNLRADNLEWDIAKTNVYAPRTGAMDAWDADEWHPLPYETLYAMGDKEHAEYCERWSKAHPLNIQTLAERILVALQSVMDNMDHTAADENPLNRMA